MHDYRLRVDCLEAMSLGAQSSLGEKDLRILLYSKVNMI